MREEIRCIGCGAKLQSSAPGRPGFLPRSRLQEAYQGDGQKIYCQRCFKLRHYGELLPVNLKSDEFLTMLNDLASKRALIVNIVDLFDFSGSLISALKRFVGANDLILVGNKVDLFPKNSRLAKMRDWMRQEANKAGLYPKKVFLVSAKKGTNLDSLLTYLSSKDQDRDIYFVGMTNVGKSTLINSIIKRAGVGEDIVTTSRFPGTTLGEIKIPLDTGHYLVDTPGIMNNQQLATLLKPSELKRVLPQKPLHPATYQLQAGNTIFLAGLGRLDIVKTKSKKISLTVYSARMLYLHRTKCSNADDFYQKQRGKLLTPPAPGDKVAALAGREFKIKEKSDVLFGGIGFITVPQGTIVRAYTPGRIGLGIRRALI